MDPRKTRPIALVAVLVAMTALLAACGDGGDEGAGPGSSIRAVQVTMLDDLRFEPSSLEVGVGETVRFVLTNEGTIVHDFSPGDAMAHTGGDHEGMAIVLEPGESGELTYTFDEAGTVEFGCHQPGHFEAGMVFTAIVS